MKVSEVSLDQKNILLGFYRQRKGFCWGTFRTALEYTKGVNIVKRDLACTDIFALSILSSLFMNGKYEAGAKCFVYKSVSSPML